MPPRSSSLFVYSQTPGPPTYKSMSQLSLFDVAFRRNEDHAPPRPAATTRERARQTDLHTFLGLPPNAATALLKRPASPLPSDTDE